MGSGDATARESRLRNIESLLLLEDSPEPRLSFGPIVSLLDSNRAISDLKSVPDSLLAFDFIMSADDSLLFLILLIVSDRPQGRLFAKSARVSLRLRSLEPRRDNSLSLSLEPHSLRMSVSCANELRRRLVVGGDVSRTSVGGEIVVIWAAESRRPRRCRSVDSWTCSRTKSSQPLPPCQTKPT